MPLSSPSPGIDTALSRAPFWLMLRRIAVLAGCVDLTYLVVFLGLGMPGMAWPNLLSLSMYVAAYWLLGRRRNVPAVLLMWTEVLVHSSVSTILLGWASGTHYFLLVFLPAVALSRSPKQASMALTFLLFVYLGLDALSQVISPVYALDPWVATALRWLSISVVFVMFGYTGRYYVEHVLLAERRLRQAATTDHLSGLSNRRHFLQLATTEMERSARYGEVLTLILADIDHFKQVNDLHGHPAGDSVIRHISSLLMAHLRSMDLVGRWGGEEFIILLPSTGLQGAAQLCERIRERVENTPCEVADGVALTVTLSFGVHQLNLAGGLEQAIQRADAALYEAKRGGRNRVTVSRADEPAAVV